MVRALLHETVMVKARTKYKTGLSIYLIVKGIQKHN